MSQYNRNNYSKARGKKSKASRKKRIITAVVAVIFLLVLGIGAYGIYAWNQISTGESVQTVPKDPVVDVSDLKGCISVLLIGTDKRADAKDNYYNTDTIILATIDTDNKRISLLSIPRDTLVTNKKGREVRINSIAGTEGITSLQQKVSDLVGLPISGYVLTDFQGFKQIIDTLGGITIDVEKDMYWETGDKEDGYINLKKGVQRLDGSKALQYARFRNDELGDISRTGRQQKVLKAIAKEMMKVSTIPKIPSLVPQLRNAVQTNISLNDMLKLATVAVTFDDKNIISQTLPGKYVGAAWGVDPEKVKVVVKNLLKGITTDDIIEYDPDSVPPAKTPDTKAPSEVPVPSDGKGTTPSNDGKGANPSNGKNGAAPSTGGNGTMPSQGGEGKGPSNGGATPPDGGSGTAPSTGGGTTPPNGGEGKDPSTGGGATPPDGGSGTAPSTGGGTTLPNGGEGTTPSSGGEITPPPGGGETNSPT